MPVVLLHRGLGRGLWPLLGHGVLQGRQSVVKWHDVGDTFSTSFLWYSHTPTSIHFRVVSNVAGIVGFILTRWPSRFLLCYHTFPSNIPTILLMWFSPVYCFTQNTSLRILESSWLSFFLKTVFNPSVNSLQPHISAVILWYPYEAPGQYYSDRS